MTWFAGHLHYKLVLSNHTSLPSLPNPVTSENSILRLVYYSSSCGFDSASEIHRAGEENSNKYSQRFGSLAAVSLFSRPHTSLTWRSIIANITHRKLIMYFKILHVLLTVAVRWGPFQQPCPCSKNIVEYLLGVPVHRPQVPSLVSEPPFRGIWVT